MLIDDSRHDNFFHERIITKGNFAEKVVAIETAKEALAYLRSRRVKGESGPELIFLDINMPGMNGWDFLSEYDNWNSQLEHPVIVVMLTTSDNPDDEKKAMNSKGVSHFKTKPLTTEMLDEIFEANPENTAACGSLDTRPALDL